MIMRGFLVILCLYPSASNTSISGKWPAGATIRFMHLLEVPAFPNIEIPKNRN